MHAEALKAIPTPPWETPRDPGSLLRVSRPIPDPSLRSSISSSNDCPLVSQVSVMIAMSASSSLKQSNNELIFWHRDLALVLMMVKSLFSDLLLTVVFIVSSRMSELSRLSREFAPLLKTLEIDSQCQACPSSQIAQCLQPGDH